MNKNESRESRIVAFTGIKGGCGCSFLSSCTATAFSIKTEKNVLLVDMAFNKKDSRIIFNLPEENLKDLGDALLYEGEIEASILKKLVINLENSMNLILPPLNFFWKFSEKIFNFIFKFFELLKENFDIIIVDFPFYIFFQFENELKELIDNLVIISLPDVLSINNLRSVVKDIFNRHPPGRSNIVINKYNCKPSLSSAGLSSLLKYPIDIFLPYDRDIEYLFLTRGPESIFKYNLKLTRNLLELTEKINKNFYD